MNRLRKTKYFVLIVLLALLLLPSTAMATSIFEHQSVNVPANQTVDDVVVIGADADIWGTVKSSLIVVNGTANIHSSAHIKGFIVIIGGKLQQDTGAEILNDIYDISFDNATKNSLLIGGGFLLGIWMIQLAGSLMIVLIPMLMLLFGKQRIVSFINKYKAESQVRLLYTGFFSGLLLAAASLLLILTIIGFPFILMIMLIILVSFIFGITILSYMIGERFRGSSEKVDLIKTTIGSFMLMATVNIPVVGLFILVVVLLYSLGITTTWVVEKTKNKKR
jgi:hypothetical protein